MSRKFTLVLAALLLVLCSLPDSAEARKLRVPGVRAVIGAPFALMRRGIVRPRMHRHTVRRARSDRLASRPPAIPTPAPTRSASAYLDALGYALWPGEYKERFWTHGIVDVTARMFDGTAEGEARAGAPKPVRVAANGDVATSHLDPACMADARVGAGALAARLAARDRDDAQRRALQAFRDALMQTADDVADVACSTAAAATPAARLRRLKEELWAVRYALTRVRPALATMFAALSDEQKAALEKPANAGDGADAPPEQSPADTTIAACGAQTPAATAWPAREIARALRPSRDQQASLERLRLTALDTAQYLAKNCPAKVADTPLQRLDATSNRLRAMIYAATVMQSATNTLFARLDADQQKRFSALRVQ